MTPEEFFFMICAWVVGSVISSIIVGFMTDKFVIKRIMKNQDVLDLISLFRDGKDYLRQVLEEQKKRG